MKKAVMVVMCGLLAQVAGAASNEFPYSWLNMQTNNFGWYWSLDEKLVGYVIDDRSRSNLPSSMRFYQGDMTFEFEGTPGMFYFEYEIADSGYHYDEHISIRAFTGNVEVPCEMLDWGDLGKGVRIEFLSAGLHKIVIHGGYHRIFSQNGATRGCVTTFSNIKWRPVSIQVPRSGKSICVPCTWLEGHRESKMSLSCENDYLNLALGVGKNGCTLADSYVAGLDPSDPESTFKTRIDFKDGKPVVTWEPALNGTDENGHSKKTGVRTYRVLGSTDLKTWSEVNDGEESRYNFFKVAVEMP